MKRKKGQPLPLGAWKQNNGMNFSIAVPGGKDCQLLLYKKGRKTPCVVYEMPEEDAEGEVRFLTVEGMDPKQYEYNFRVEDQIIVDPFVRKVSGHEKWNHPVDVDKHEVRGRIPDTDFDWEGDRPLKLPWHQIVAYSLHVRGFTRHSSSRAEYKGTFAGIVEKIPYLKELGINQIHCMPVYEFEECGQKINYWGYGPASYFAPKSAYASGKDADIELKDMIKSCHKAGIEVVFEMPFERDVPEMMMVDCLRYYRLEYHVDGFILNPDVAPMSMLLSDPVLKSARILKHQNEFRNVMRRFLKGDEGMVPDVMHWLKYRGDGTIFNDITGQNGFTLRDLVSYNEKHNEANGEKNRDGEDYNFSWNCGMEGESRKKDIKKLRSSQMKNALFLLLLAQGVPCILAGDEFGNTQKGNNNVYCQDNLTGWLDWRLLDKEKELYGFLKQLIVFRKNHPIFCQKQELTGKDRIGCGIPDVSYHGREAWKTPSERSSRQLGVFYCGKSAGDEDTYVIYNMHWLEHVFALPFLGGGRKWYLVASTEEGFLEEPCLVENQRELEVKGRTIAVLTGKKELEAENEGVATLLHD